MLSTGGTMIRTTVLDTDPWDLAPDAVLVLVDPDRPSPSEPVARIDGRLAGQASALRQGDRREPLLLSVRDATGEGRPRPVALARVDRAAAGRGPLAVALPGEPSDGDERARALEREAWRVAGASAARAASRSGLRSWVLVVDAGVHARAAIAAAVEGALLGAHRTRREGIDAPEEGGPEDLTVVVPASGDDAALESLRGDVRRAAVLADATGWARDAVDAPANRMTPARLAEVAAEAGRAAGLRVHVHDEAWMRERGMGALLAVAQGSAQPPRVVVMEHRPDRRDLPSVAWVGKGVTFDSGGLSLKDRTSMPAMKGDMAGAAAVLGAALAVARLDLPVRMVTIAVLVENMPDGAAYRPSDVVVAADGTAIEIVSTDAEGRLALADGLLYAQEFGCDVACDVATLTGGAVVALGEGTSAAAFGSDRDWSALLAASALRAGEAIWPMPIYDAYLRAIESRVADLKNGGVREGSAGIAAAFLQRFAPPRWAHLDIAGIAWTTKPSGVWNEGATGYGVRLMVEATDALASSPAPADPSAG
jgi:leucyl aminopeptidase